MIFDPRTSGLGKGDWRIASEEAGPVTVTPDPAVIAFTAIDPTVIADNPVTVTPDPAVFAFTAVDPTVLVGGAIAVAPDPATFALSAISPTVLGGGKRGGLIPAMISGGL